MAEIPENIIGDEMLWIFRNYQEDLIQKTAWRLVRSAEDKIGAGRGAEKFAWCVDRMYGIFSKEKRTDLDDHVRAAYMNFRLEHVAIERRI